ncbi:MAG: hypothetical protein E7054_08975 [Lentisphaerae bacterium]|nr:hypothetical protein [Lentisphaerota bacterium]
MIFKKEHYFPSLRSFEHRVARWERLKPEKLPGYLLVPGKPVSVLECTLPDFPGVTPGKVIAYLSDLHFHDSKKSDLILHHLLELLTQYKVDYLLLGGDMTGDADDMPQLAGVLKKLAACAGTVLAVGGNWEYGKFWLEKDFWQRFYADAGITYLKNEIYSGDGIDFCGLADLASGWTKLPALDMGKLNIMLAHNPDAAVAVDRHKVPEYPQLILAGHNHGGQVNIPLLNIPIHIHSRYGNFFAHGIFRHRNRNSTMIVSAGVNELSFPWRINCRRELIIMRTGYQS